MSGGTVARSCPHRMDRFPHALENSSRLLRHGRHQHGPRRLQPFELGGWTITERGMQPSFSGMSGRAYLAGALMLGFGLLWMGARLAMLRMPLTSAVSKLRARQLLQATIVYLPVLFLLMMTDCRL